MPVNFQPKLYHTVTPYLIIKGAARAIDFYQRAFGATVIVRMDGDQGQVGHAEIKIGDSVVMLADEYPAMGHQSPVADQLYGDRTESSRTRSGTSGTSPRTSRTSRRKR